MLAIFALPCRYVIVDPSGYHSCALLGESTLCQSCNPNLNTVTVKGSIATRFTIKKGKISFDIIPGSSKITERHDPRDEIDLDKQCPAGYTWEQVQAKERALNELLPDYRLNDRQAALATRMISEMLDGVPLDSLGKPLKDTKADR